MLPLFAKLLFIAPDRLKHILAIGVPIIGGMMSQSLLNLVDAAMVGRLGETALAGVGVGSYATFLAVALVMGLSAGVQSMVARRMGEGNEHLAMRPLNAGLMLSIITAIPLSIFFIATSEWSLAIYNSNPEVLAIAVPYYDWRLYALIAVALNFSFRGYWNGIGQSKVYLQIILIMHALNIFISYFLIFGWNDISLLGFLPRFEGYGAVGSGMGTSIALALGTLIYIVLTVRHSLQLNRNNKSDDKSENSVLLGLPHKETFKQIVQLAIPNSTQQFMFSLGISALFWIIGQVGTAEQAIAHILINLALLLILPSIGLGMAATTLVSHALGEGDKERAYQYGWEVVRVTAVILFILGLPLWIAPHWVLAVFTTDVHLIELGELPLRITGINIIFEVAALVLTQALLGAGASKQVMLINFVMQWCFLLPLAFLIGPILGYGLIGIWLIQGVQRISLSAVYAWVWNKRKWAEIRI